MYTHIETNKALRRQYVFTNWKKTSNFKRNSQMTGKSQAFGFLNHEIQVVPITVSVSRNTEMNVHQHWKNNE